MWKPWENTGETGKTWENHVTNMKQIKLTSMRQICAEKKWKTKRQQWMQMHSWLKMFVQGIGASVSVYVCARASS